MFPEPGDILSGYRIDRVLGQGGMGVVFEATQLSLDRKIALKVVAPHLSANAAFTERFRREGLLQAAADHPHILPVYEAGEDRGLLFLAMRLVRGPNLSELIQQHELPVERSLTLLGQVADALDSAHEAGMVHRDVKPQNVLVDRGDFALLADFGLTRALGDQGVTGTGELVGSIHYLSPEQIRGLPPSAKSDLYAFAAVLYQCLVGRPPFTGEVDAAVIYAHMSEDPPLVSVAQPELPEELDAVVARGLAKDPDQRYPTARELIGDARAALAMPSDQAPTRSLSRAVVDEASGENRTAVASPPRRTRAHWLLGVGVVSVVAVLATGGFAIGKAGSGGESESAGFAGSGPIGLSLPAKWQRLPQPPKIPGLGLADSITVGPVGGGGGLTAGRTQATGPSLLPAAFRRSTQLPKKTAVRLGSYEAYRYRGIRGDGIEGELTVYAVPTSRGVVTLACSDSPPAQPTIFGACERVAATLDLTGVRTYPLGPSSAFAASLQNAVSSLDAARAALRRILAAAGTPAGQADAARELADAYSSAADRLTTLDVGPEAEPARRSIVAALRASEAAHRRLAQAAIAGNNRAYAKARTSIAATEQGVVRALRALSGLGYETESKG